jgi:acyl carrier protein
MTTTKSEEEIQSWISTYIANELDVDVAELDPEVGFEEFGLDSALAVGLTGDLEEWLQTRVNPTIFYNYTTISSLSKHLAESLESRNQ